MKKLQKLVAVAMTAAVVAGIGGNLMAARKNVSIDAAHFPDPEFRKLVSSYDTNHNGLLSDYEAQDVSTLYLVSSDIENLDGIKYLPYIKELVIYDIYLNKLDLSDNLALTKVKLIKVFGLTELTPSHITTDLEIDNCESLKKINLEDADYLSRLTLVRNGKLKGSLDASVSKYLQQVLVEETPLSTIYVNKNAKLNSVSFNGKIVKK